MRQFSKRCFSVCLALSMAITTLSINAKAAQGDGKLTGFTLRASSEHTNNPITNAQDGNNATFWETNWAGSDFTPSEDHPIEVVATFAEPVEVGIMKIMPRQGNNANNGDMNGRFQKVRYTKYDASGDPIGASFTETYGENLTYPTQDPVNVSINDVVKSVKLEILSSYSTTATMAELEFYAPKESNGIALMEANTEQSANGQGIDKAYDQDPATYWHSAWSGFSVTQDHPAIVTITRDQSGPMAELYYTTRTYAADGDDNGNIRFMNIYTSKDKNEWTLLTHAQWGSEAGTKRVSLLGNDDPYLKLEIVEGTNHFASAAEFKIVALTSKDQMDASIIEIAQALGISENAYQGWTASTAIDLMEALTAAKQAYAGDDLSLMLQTLHTLQLAYDGLRVDKQPLLDAIEAAKAVDCAGKNPSSVVALQQAIANALSVVDMVTDPSEVAFEVTQLQEAMLLNDEPVKELQNVSDASSFVRNNPFNEGWLFKETTEDGASISLDESQYSSIDLPHDFSITKEFTEAGEAESGFLLGGTGWYRKHIVIPQSMEDRVFQLSFDGAYMDTYVYVNGQKIGENHNGYNDFTFDISDALICDGISDNVISVKVINDLPSSRWYSGSGIYRNVTLRMLDPTHINEDDLFIATPHVDAAQSLVQISGSVSSVSEATTLQTTILAPDGSTAVQSEKLNITDVTFDQSLQVENPELWTVKNDHPALYIVVVQLFQGEHVVDEYQQRIGFKSVAFDRDEGFFLNGENIKLKGVCMHHDQGALGAAENYHSVYRQMKIMKDMGVNSIRVTHAPASKVFLDVCDELGLLVINEAFDHLYYSKNNNYNDFARWFKVAIGENGPINSTPDMSWAEFVAKQMVRSSRNHASILMYSVGNELLEGGGSDDGYIKTVADICQWFKEIDPYHIPTIGDNKAKGNNSMAVALCEEVHKAGGVIGFNYADQGQYDDLRSRHPEWILYGSETSSAHHSRNVYDTAYKDEEHKLCTDYENEIAKAGWGHSASTAWKFVEENDWNLGEYVWTGFDYFGEPTPWNKIDTGSQSGMGPLPRSSFFGIVETTGFAKDIYYLYQALWNEDVRTLHMSESWNEGLLKTNDQVMVQVFSDADKVILYKDGIEVASKTSTKKANGTRVFDNQKYYAEFTLTYDPGTISVKAFDRNDAGEYVAVSDTIGRNSVTTSKKASTTSLSADKTSLACDGYDLSYITIDLLDDAGNFVPDNNQKLYVTLEGEGAIVGMDNGNQSDIQSFRIDDPKRATRNAFNGKALVIVQSTKRAGTIKLQVKGVGLSTSTMTLTTASSSTSDTLTTLELVSKYTTLTGNEVSLPETITGIFDNGNSQALAVRWDTSNVDYAKAGTYPIKGYLDGYSAIAQATIYVYDTLTAAQGYSTVMHEGSMISLPNTRKVYYANGTIAQEFPVTWEYHDVASFVAGNTYQIQGTVVVAGQRLPVEAHIRVVAPLPEARNLARLSEDMPVLSQSCTNVSDNLASLNNGIKVSTSGNERWTDFNQKDERIPWVSYEWNQTYMISNVIAYIYQDANSHIPRELELKIETRNAKGEWAAQEISYITPVAYNDGDGKTTISLKQPVETNGIRLHLVKLSTGTFTGLTELEVFEYIPKVVPVQNTKIDGVTINGETLREFDPENQDSVVLVEEYPDFETMQISPEGVDDTATYVILKEEESHTIRILIRAEDGSEATYTITYQRVASKVELQELYDAYATQTQGFYTDESWKALQSALQSAKSVLEQHGANAEEIEQAKGKLQQAIQGLQLRPADYSKVDAAIQRVPNDLSVYTSESLQALQAALAAVVEGKKIDEQAIVDGYAGAIDAAIQALILRQGELIMGGIDPVISDIVKGSISQAQQVLIDTLNAQGIDVALHMDIVAKTQVEIDAEDLTQLHTLSENKGILIGAYFDLSITLQAQGEIIGHLGELSDEIAMELVIPNDLRKEGRTFYVIRIHEGKAEILDSIEQDGILRFQTDRFSTYAIAYDKEQADVPTDPDKPSDPEQPIDPDKPMDPEQPMEPSGPDEPSNPSDSDNQEPSMLQPSVGEPSTTNNQSPNTGDTTNVTFYFMSCLLAGAILCYRRKQKDNVS